MAAARATMSTGEQQNQDENGLPWRRHQRTRGGRRKPGKCHSEQEGYGESRICTIDDWIITRSLIRTHIDDTYLSESQDGGTKTNSRWTLFVWGRGGDNDDHQHLEDENKNENLTKAPSWMTTTKLEEEERGAGRELLQRVSYNGSGKMKKSFTHSFIVGNIGESKSQHKMISTTKHEDEMRTTCDMRRRWRPPKRLHFSVTYFWVVRFGNINVP